MAEKTPGRDRKSTSSRKKETAQETSQKTSTVTPIDQAGTGQSGTKEGSNLAGSSQNPPVGAPGQSSSVSGSAQTPSQIGAHPSADQGGVGRGKHSGSSPSVLNPSGSIQEGRPAAVQEERHAAGVRPSGQELQERIRARAYELFEQRGRQEGFDQEDWAQAEAEVLAEFEREKSA